MMRYIHFTGGNGYCGCDIDEYVEFEGDTLDEDLDQYAADLAADNGETFSYVATGWGEDFESEQEENDYYENCWCNWEEVSEEEYEENK